MRIILALIENGWQYILAFTGLLTVCIANGIIVVDSALMEISAGDGSVPFNAVFYDASPEVWQYEWWQIAVFVLVGTLLIGFALKMLTNRILS